MKKFHLAIVFVAAAMIAGTGCSENRASQDRSSNQETGPSLPQPGPSPDTGTGTGTGTATGTTVEDANALDIESGKLLKRHAGIEARMIHGTGVKLKVTTSDADRLFSAKDQSNVVLGADVIFNGASARVDADRSRKPYCIVRSLVADIKAPKMGDEIVFDQITLVGAKSMGELSSAFNEGAIDKVLAQVSAKAVITKLTSSKDQTLSITCVRYTNDGRGNSLGELNKITFGKLGVIEPVMDAERLDVLTKIHQPRKEGSILSKALENVQVIYANGAGGGITLILTEAMQPVALLNTAEPANKVLGSAKAYTSRAEADAKESAYCILRGDPARLTVGGQILLSQISISGVVKGKYVTSTLKTADGKVSLNCVAYGSKVITLGRLDDIALGSGLGKISVNTQQIGAVGIAALHGVVSDVSVVADR